MVKVLIQTGKAVSLGEVSRQIAYVGEKKGHIVYLNRQTPSWISYRDVCDAVIFFYPLIPTWCINYIYEYYKARNELGGKSIFYTTIEGVPKRHVIWPWIRERCEFIANSKFTAWCLRKAGLKVKDIVYHGVLFDEIDLAYEKVDSYRKTIEEYHKGKVAFGVVVDDNPRKGLSLLIEAINKLSEKRSDFVVLLITKQNVMEKIENVPNVYFVAEFGSRSHDEIMGFMGACDWLIQPSLCEGFCLPLLESMAMGTPVIHGNFPPLMEITDKKGNILIPISKASLVNSDDGVAYMYHYYDPLKLAEAMSRAIDIVKEDSDRYNDMRERVKEKARKFDSKKLYSKLYKYLGI